MALDRCLTDFFEEISKTVQQGQSDGVFIKDVPLLTYTHMITGTFDQYLLSQFLLRTPPLGLTELYNTVDTLVNVIKVRK